MATNNEIDFEQQGRMNEETQKYFALGLREAIAKSKLTQKAFADGITTEVNLSGVLRLDRGTSEKMRQKMAKRLGLDVSEIVLIGRKIAHAQESYKHYEELQMEAPVKKQQEFIGPVQHLTSFITAYSKMESDSLFWQSVFEHTLTPTVIIFDGTTVSQNAAHRRLVGSSYVGTRKCPCCDMDGKHAHGCKVRQTELTGEENSDLINTSRGHFKMSSTMFSANSKSYTIVSLVPCEKLKKVEQDHKTMKEMIYSVIDSAFTGALLIDRDGVITHCNKKLLAMFDIERGTLRAIQDLFGYLAENAKNPSESILALRRSQSKAPDPEPTLIELHNGVKLYLEFKAVTDINESWLGSVLRVYGERMFDALFCNGYER